MRILFVLKQKGYVRHFEAAVRALAERGHVVRLAFQDGEHGLPPGLEGLPAVTATTCASKRGDEWQEQVSLVRRTSDYLRYLKPPFRQAGKLRTRAFDKLVKTFSFASRVPEAGWSDVGLALTEPEVDRVQALIRLIERSVPADRGFSEFLRQEAPDVLLVSPLVDIGSGQADLVKAARELGIPTIMVLFSWDNLSTKGLIHELPDALLVWNELQRREAVEMHGVPPKHVRVTGAPRFDPFFASRSVISREEFCASVGFDPGQPIILYLGSSKFVAEHEEQFIDAWAAAVREVPSLRKANLLIKPHPDLHRNQEEPGQRHAWATAAGPIRARIHRSADRPGTATIRAPFSGVQALYECIFHSAAVVGLNTSAELEAAIIGRPVLTIRVPESYADGQESTLHFHYLLESSGGFVQSASSLDEHCAALARTVDGQFDGERMRAFIQEFLRPHGLDRPAADVMASAVERVVERAAKRRATLAATHAEVSVGQSTASGVEQRPTAGPETVLLDYAPIAIQLAVTSDAERKWRVHACRKEPWTVEWLERHSQPGSVLYDVGANVGAFSLIAAMCSPGVKVVAFEPGYATYAHLCDNIVLNGCQDRIIPVPVPLWSATKMVSFKYRSLEAGQSRHAMRELKQHRSRKDRYEQPVFAFRLDDLVTQFGLPAPTHLKLDVDGAEVEVLKGAGRTLRSPGLLSLLVEYDEQLTEPVTRLLAEAGFEMSHPIERHKADAPLYAEFRRP